MAQALGTSIEDLRSYDTRPPVEDLKRLTSSNPLYGIAFRKVVDKAVNKKISPEELMEFVEEEIPEKEIMRTYRTTSGPFAERPHYKVEEVEQICRRRTAEGRPISVRARTNTD